MKKKGLLKTFKSFTKKRTPEILVGFGIVGTITTTVLAVKATPKAMSLIDDAAHMDENGMPIADSRELTKVEIVKVAWKPYIPAVISFMVSTGCLIGASSVNFKRNAALATAYELSRSALSDYREKVVETIGENEEKKIRSQINQNKIENASINENDIIQTGKGTTLCFDPMSGRFFRSDPAYIKKCVNDLNRMLFTDVYVSLNAFYSLLGLKEATCGDAFGWNINYDNGVIDIDFTGQMTDCDEPCAVIDYISQPVYEFDKYW